ncbi:MAG TPA: hypothetical protein DDZ76_09730, partial [Xanthomonadales bacterium]|nr:hypothetical protein [Xanthomonadales bacterium]
EGAVGAGRTAVEAMGGRGKREREANGGQAEAVSVRAHGCFLAVRDAGFGGHIDNDGIGSEWIGARGVPGCW